MNGHFDEIASIFRAQSIQRPIGSVYGVDKVFEHGAEFSGWEDEFRKELPAIVVSNDAPVGWFCCEAAFPISKWLRGERQSSVAVRDVMNSFDPTDVIAPDTTFLTCIELIAKNPGRLLVVVDSGHPVGTIAFRELFDPIGRLCLLRLVLDLEVAAIELIFEQGYEGTQSWIDEEIARENEGCRESSFERMTERFVKRHPTYKNLHGSLGEDDRTENLIRLWLASLPFSRRREIINSRNLVVTASGTELDQVFGRAEFLRNCCAHPTGFEDARFYWTPDPEFDESKFAKLYRDIRSLTNEMREQAERERKIANLSD
jgi:hypothetical protein